MDSAYGLLTMRSENVRRTIRAAASVPHSSQFVMPLVKSHATLCHNRDSLSFACRGMLAADHVRFVSNWGYTCRFVDRGTATGHGRLKTLG